MFKIKVSGLDAIKDLLKKKEAEIYIKNVEDQIGEFWDEIISQDPNAVVNILPNGEAEFTADLTKELWDRIKAAQKP